MNKYRRILVQDSTIIRLPSKLYDLFSGVKNATTTVCNARIQGIYDLVSRQFIQFSIDPYSKNDLAVVFDISVQPGDLVLRDRGYFSVKAIEAFKNKGTDSILRYKHKKSLFDIETGKEIHLLKYLTKHGSMDKMILIGANEKYPVRILAKPVNEETANLRRMKAKKEQRGKNPSEELLKLMSWTIFVTSITQPDISFEIINTFYSFRWRIENIFKTWKSNFSFAKIHNVSAQQIQVLICARLIMATLFVHRIFNRLSGVVKKSSGKTLSMMKFMRYISKNLDVIGRLVNIEKISNRTIEAINRFCTYDKRKRLNFENQFECFLNPARYHSLA